MANSVRFPRKISNSVSDTKLSWSLRTDWTRLTRSPSKTVRTAISLKPLFDESCLPDGAYQLRVEKGNWQMNRRAGTWALSEDSLRDIIRTKIALRFSRRSRSHEHFQPLTSVNDFGTIGLPAMGALLILVVTSDKF